MHTLRIGDVAAQAEVAVDTVRYYERRGVLLPVSRRSSGYREFTAATVERIRFVKALQSIGFTLDNVIDMLHDMDAGVATCDAEQPRLEKVLARVDDKIRGLQEVRRKLAKTIRRCRKGTCTLLETKPSRRRPQGRSST